MFGLTAASGNAGSEVASPEALTPEDVAVASDGTSASDSAETGVAADPHMKNPAVTITIESSLRMARPPLIDIPFSSPRDKHLDVPRILEYAMNSVHNIPIFSGSSHPKASILAILCGEQEEANDEHGGVRDCSKRWTSTGD
jgi:hypothetical protein